MAVHIDHGVAGIGLSRLASPPNRHNLRRFRRAGLIAPNPSGFFLILLKSNSISELEAVVSPFNSPACLPRGWRGFFCSLPGPVYNPQRSLTL